MLEQGWNGYVFCKYNISNTNRSAYSHLHNGINQSGKILAHSFDVQEKLPPKQARYYAYKISPFNTTIHV